MRVELQVNSSPLVLTPVAEQPAAPEINARRVPLPPPRPDNPMVPSDLENGLNDRPEALCLRQKGAGQPIDVRDFRVTFAPCYWTGLALSRRYAAA